MLRFDFSGLDNSEGDFANTNFSSNIADLLAAASGMRAAYKGPDLLIGHSLGGAAVLAVAHEMPEVKARRLWVKTGRSRYDGFPPDKINSTSRFSHGFILSNGFEPPPPASCSGALWRKGRFGLRLSTGLLLRTER